MWIDPEGIMLREISQTERDKHHIISLTCEILKKQKEINEKTSSYIENRMVVAREGGSG